MPCMGGLGHLLYFSALQLLVYMDRSTMAGLLPLAQDQFGFTDFQSGLLGTGFIVGFMLPTPLVGLAHTHNQVIGSIGGCLVLWVFASFLACLARGYWTLLAARVLAGFGEAAFSALALPMMQDTAPPANQSLFLALYYAAIFVGASIGFVVQAPVSTWAAGRFLFLIIGGMVFPLSLFVLLRGDRFHTQSLSRSRDVLSEEQAPAVQSPGNSRAQSPPPDSALRTAGAVVRSPIFDFLVLGYASQQFVIGGFAFWAPAYLEKHLKVDKDTVGYILGCATIGTGVIGAIGGGLALDLIVDKVQKHIGVQEGVRGLVATGVCTVLGVLVVPTTLAAIKADAGSGFFTFLVLTELTAFAGAAPMVAAFMESVPREVRGLAMSLSMFGGHLFGDMLSPMLVGMLSGILDSLYHGMICLAVVSLVNPFACGVATLFSWFQLRDQLRQRRRVELPEPVEMIVHS